LKVRFMPTFVVYDPNGSYTAAAVMAKTGMMAAAPEKGREFRLTRARAEKTRPGNPNQLTLNQHVFPTKSIERFASADGRVNVRILDPRDKVIRPRPDNAIFGANRAWDQRAESGYMKRIEDRFQRVADAIVAGRSATVSAEERPAIDEMYALWYWRARFRELESQETQLNGVAGANLSLEQEENLENNGYMFARQHGAMPTRQLNGAVVEMRTGFYVEELAKIVTRWGILMAQSGEFIVPDVPWHGVIPLTPRHALVWNTPDGVITEQNLGQVNSAARSVSEVYYFARDLTRCPFA
jgi:hypothetical protein